AIIAEVELNDELALGIRVSNSDDILSGGNPDFRIGGTSSITGSETNPLSSLFDTSLLDATIGINAVIQALHEVTNVRILQEPIIFTADNQEAIFFDGQDIPFITNTVINAQGNPNDSFEYREVGVTLNVRPRITVEKDVDIEVLLELSSVVPGVTIFGAAVLDKRESRTNIVVRDGQTVVISGILRDEVSKITRKIPLLGDIPLIGELFKSRENSTVTTELIAFITPQVVDHTDGEADFQREFRDRLEDLSQPVDDKPINRREMLDHPDEFRSRGWMTPKLTLPETPGEDEGVSPGAKKDRNDPFKVYR
ncbi:MAG: type II secretion system protein GspD, partial [Phycisphaerales bacterium]|nr:type II secretion system protein GspD [Phycisphaerales bacterium]